MNGVKRTKVYESDGTWTLDALRVLARANMRWRRAWRFRFFWRMNGGELLAQRSDVDLGGEA